MLQAAQDERPTSGRFSGELQIGEAAEQGGNCGTAFESAELGPGTEVGTQSECDMGVGFAPDVEPIGFPEDRSVTVGSAKTAQDQIPLFDRLSVPFEVLCCDA